LPRWRLSFDTLRDVTASSAEDFSIRSYVAEVMPDCSFESITLVERLRSGENHVVHRVSYVDPGGDGRDVIVRAGAGVDAEQVRAHREAIVMRKVGGVVGPGIHDFRPRCPGFDGPIMCMQFLAGDQPALNRVRQPDLQRLGEVVQRLHALPVDDLTDWGPGDLSLPTYAKERWRAHLAFRLPAIRDPLPGALQRRLRAAVGLASDDMEALMARLHEGTEESLVLLHADISGANVIWAPHPVLIDWEYARLGDAADEVGYLFTQNDLGQAHRAAFWRGYGRRITATMLDRILQRVRLWEPTTLLGSVMWWLDAWSRAEATPASELVPLLPRTAEYYLQQAIERLDRFERMFSSA
jgi:thiamine kinase-like enzyme